MILIDIVNSVIQMDEIVIISENGIFEKILNGNVMDLQYGIDSWDEKGKIETYERK